ncbi:MAG TPA: glycosyltransferase family 4 protein [Bryobacteraceae bacterium]|nr:glycosyltransferase family 4 protein [Bryobacteraceae bacterium]
MNVLLLDQFGELGGAQRVLLDTVAAAQQRGWGVWAALPATGPLSGLLRSRGVAVVRIPCGPYNPGTKDLRDLLRFLLDLLRQVRLIRSLVKRTRFDLIYVNGPRVLPAAALAAHAPARVLFHAHSHIGQRLARTLVVSSIRHAGAAVVACSDSVMQALRGSVNPESQFVIPNGVPEIVFRDREFGRDGKWRIGVIGRISPEKGQAEFLRAAAVLQREFPKAEFVICGAPLYSAPSYFDRVQELARGLPVQFLGWRDDIGPVLSDLDLLAVPSQQEGMGRVVVEAYSAGVPVVAFATGGIPEIVSDGETGFLVQQKTPEAFAQGLSRTMRSDPTNLRRIAANARRAWESRYTARMYQDRISQVMQSVADPAKQKTALGG